MIISLTEANQFVIFVCSCLCLCSVYKKKNNLIFKKNNVGEGGEVRDGKKSGRIDFLFDNKSFLSMLKKIKARTKKMIMNDQIVLLVPPTCQCKEIFKKSVISKKLKKENRSWVQIASSVRGMTLQ